MGTIISEDLSDLFIDAVRQTMVRQPAPVEHPDLMFEYLVQILCRLAARNADERRGLYLELWRNLHALTNFFIGLNRGRNVLLTEDALKGEHRAMREIGDIIVFDVSMRRVGEKRHVLASENSLGYAERIFRYLSEEDPIRDDFSELYGDFAQNISSPVVLLRETKDEIIQIHRLL